MKLSIFGDLHANRTRSLRLLADLGHRRPTSTRAHWAHPEGAIAAFTGDYVDGGDENLATIELVAEIVAGGHGIAVMGNHDFNLLALLTEDPESPGTYLRKRTPENLAQSGAAIAEIEAHPERGRKALTFLRSLPLWIDLPSLRIAHAHWDAGAIATLRTACDASGALTDDGFVKAARKDTDIGRARLLIQCGPEMECEPFPDRFGRIRTKRRTDWWEDHHADGDPRPLFFGHYGMPRPLAPIHGRYVCVDAGIAHGGRIGAYSHETGKPLDAKRFSYG